MTRLLVLLAVTLVVVYLVTGLLERLRDGISELLQASGARGPVANRDPRSRPTDHAVGRDPTPGRASRGQLVACTACGIHVVKSRALAEHRGSASPGGRARFYCSESCRRVAAVVS